MRTLVPRLCVLALVVLATPLAGAQQSGDAPLATPSDRLRALAGDWDVLDADGQPSGLSFRYAVVAGGAAVQETALAGTDQETITLYHSEDGLVTVTQVSRRGRPDRLVPTEEPGTDTLHFAADGRSARRGRLVSILLSWVDAHRLRVSWTHAAGDEQTTCTSFELRRQVDLEELADRVARARVTLEGLQRELDRRLKARIRSEEPGRPPRTLREVRTLPTDPGWNVAGTPFRLFLHDQTVRFASTYAADGDAGHSLGHYPFRAGRGCRVRFSVLGGHGYIAIVAEQRPPPRKGASVEEVSRRLLEGEYGAIVESVTGRRWTEPVAFEWDLSRFEGKSLRLYVVDAVSDHYGQIAVSEVSITEEVDE